MSIAESGRVTDFQPDFRPGSQEVFEDRANWARERRMDRLRVQVPIRSATEGGSK